MNLKTFRKQAARLACAGCLALIAATPQAQAPGAAPAPGAGLGPDMMGPVPEIKFVPARPKETVIAEIDGKPFTIGELQDWARYSTLAKLTGEVLPERYPELPDDALAQLTRTVAARLAAARDVEALPTAEQMAYLQQLEPQAEQVVLNYLGTTRIVDKVTTPSEEVLKEYYEKHKELFNQPFRFSMRHFVLLTYEKYSVREGDTLESIAGRIAGDEKLADEIRADVASRPGRRGKATDFKPLEPGEDLLVPMNPQAAEKVRQRLEGYLKEIEGGKTFEELAEAHSESDAKGQEIGPLPDGTKPMLEELIEMGRKTEIGAVSPIFRTKHGFQAIQVTKKQEAGLRSYDSVRQIIINRLLSEKRKEAQDELLSGLYADPRRIVHYDRFTKRDELTSSTVMAEIEGSPVKVLFGEIKDDWERRGQPQTTATLDTYLKSNRTLMVGLARLEGERLMQDPNSELSRRIKFAGSDVFGAVRLELLAREQAAQRIKDEDVTKFYEENKETFFKKPVFVSFAVLERELSAQQQTQLTEPEQRKNALDQLMQGMAAELQGYKSSEDFINHQLQTAQAAGAKPITEKDVRIESLPEYIREPLKALEPGQWTKQPFLAGEKVTALLLQARSEEGYIPLETVKQAIIGKLSEPHLIEIGDQLREQYAAKVGYQFKLKAS